MERHYESHGYGHGHSSSSKMEVDGGGKGYWEQGNHSLDGHAHHHSHSHHNREGHGHNHDENSSGSGRKHEEKSASSRSSRKSSHRDRSESEAGGRRKERVRTKSRSRSKSKSRSRSRDRDRSSRHRRKEKKRHRRRSSSRSTKSRSRSRSRSSDRRSRHHRRRRQRSSSRHSSDDYSDYRSDYKTQYDSYKYQEPNSTIMVRGLAVHLTENDIRQDVLKCGIMVKDIRLIRNRDTGASRGFAFVEFNSVAEATRWMDMKKGLLVLQDQFQANLIYSIPKIPSAEGGSSKAAIDWFCDKCHAHNFKRREFCYKCNAARPEEQDVDLYDEISAHPTSTIILSNLDTLTTEEGVLQAFQSRPTIACIPIKTVRIAREPSTGISRGVCYVEANNVSDATRLFALLSHEALIIDGKPASAAYGKPASHATILKNSNAAAAALAAAQWTNSSSTAPSSSVPPCTEVKTETDVETMAQYSASLYAKTSEEYASYLDYYRNYYKKEMLKGSSADTSSKHVQQHLHTSNASHAAVVAASGSHASFGWSDKQDIGSQQGVPDTSRYQYDETSGYYFDPVSGLYYDANTQYFYDAEKQQFLHWSPQDKKYVAVTGSCDGDTSDKVDILNGDDDSRRKGKKVEKQDKVKVAKRIAKEMEKWAKTLNQKKDALRHGPGDVCPITSSSIAANASSGATSLTNKSGFLEQEYIYTAAENITTYQPASTVETIRKPHPDFEDSGSDDERYDFNPMTKESSLVDEDKLSCLLCKRRFTSLDILQKHVKMSDLHKKNLEELRQGSYAGPSSSSTKSYRDRAKERRDKFGSDANVSKNTLKDLYLQAKKDLSTSYVEEPTKAGIKDDNIGNRMLQRMGWQEGQGLGRDNQGRVDIIMAERRAGKFGLGIRGPEVLDEKMDPQAKARKLTIARYHELD